jgi:hypothetical protein
MVLAARRAWGHGQEGAPAATRQVSWQLRPMLPTRQ